MNNINELLENLVDEQTQLNLKLKGLNELQPKIQEFPLDLRIGFGYPTCIDIEYPGRKAVVDLITHFKAGKWDKELSGVEGKINYLNKTLLSLPLRIYAAEPPPSCRIVEEDTLIPAQPARVIKRKKVVCTEHQLTPI